MKLVMTMVVRDEDDILEANFDYHLARGVDFIIATDHDSTDGTAAILERYAAQGKLHALEEHGQEAKWFPQGPFFTRMARLAATDFGADWVINCDADEFWWPAEGSLKDMFARISPRYGAMTAPIVEFFPRAGGTESFAHRMTIREVRSWATYKMAHRAVPDVEVSTGSHNVTGSGLAVAPVWPARILHYPVRSVAQLEKRARLRARSGKHVYRAQYEAYVEGRLGEYYAEHALSDTDAESGIRHGYLVEDRRLAAFLDGERPGIDAEQELADIRDDMIHAHAREQRRQATGRDRRIGRALDRIVKLEGRTAKLTARHQELAEQISWLGPISSVARKAQRSLGRRDRGG